MKRALPDAEVLDNFPLGYKELVDGGMSFADAGREAEARAVQQIGIQEAIVPGDFPLALADLRKDGVVLTVDDAAVELRRRAKASAELERIRAAQRAAEAGVIELPDEAESISYRWAASRGRRARSSSGRSPCLA